MTTLAQRVQDAVEAAGDREMDYLEGLVSTCLLDLLPSLTGADARTASIGVTALFRRIAQSGTFPSADTEPDVPDGEARFFGPADKASDG